MYDMKIMVNYSLTNITCIASKGRTLVAFLIDCAYSIIKCMVSIDEIQLWTKKSQQFSLNGRCLRLDWMLWNGCLLLSFCKLLFFLKKRKTTVRISTVGGTTGSLDRYYRHLYRCWNSNDKSLANQYSFTFAGYRDDQIQSNKDVTTDHRKQRCALNHCEMKWELLKIKLQCIKI